MKKTVKMEKMNAAVQELDAEDLEKVSGGQKIVEMIPSASPKTTGTTATGTAAKLKGMGKSKLLPSEAKNTIMG